MIDNFDLKQIVKPLQDWFDGHARVLPWRENPTAYYVWISEIMLQQTRVEAVKPYFQRFITELPDVKSLAECPEDRYLKLWEGSAIITGCAISMQQRFRSWKYTMELFRNLMRNC